MLNCQLRKSDMGVCVRNRHNRIHSSSINNCRGGAGPGNPQAEVNREIFGIRGCGNQHGEMACPIV